MSSLVFWPIQKQNLSKYPWLPLPLNSWPVFFYFEFCFCANVSHTLSLSLSLSLSLQFSLIYINLSIVPSPFLKGLVLTGVNITVSCFLLLL